jgi:hypothetical protein
VYLEHRVDQVQDPVVGDSRASIERALAKPVGRERRVGGLDDEDRRGRMGIAIVGETTSNDRDVGLGLGGVVQRDRSLEPGVEPGTERAFQREPGAMNGGDVTTPLGLPHHQEAVEELHTVVRAEDADLDEPIVLVAGPSPGPKGRHSHDVGRRYRTSAPGSNVTAEIREGRSAGTPGAAIG